jgi:hypothetical protein
MERRIPFSYDAFGSTLRLVGLGPGSSWIAVTMHEVHVHMGWAFDVTIPRSAIVRAEPAQPPQGFGSMIAGWGVHTLFNGTWFVNGSQSNLVRLDLRGTVRGCSLFIPVTVGTLYLSPEDPQTFLEALR